MNSVLVTLITKMFLVYWMYIFLLHSLVIVMTDEVTMSTAYYSCIYLVVAFAGLLESLS